MSKYTLKSETFVFGSAAEVMLFYELCDEDGMALEASDEDEFATTVHGCEAELETARETATKVRPEV